MEAEEDKGSVLAQDLIDTINSVASHSDYKCVINRDYSNLARRLKLLIPMFEEIRDSQILIREHTLRALLSFKQALDSSANFLRLGCEGSRIYLVLERDHAMRKLYEVTTNVEQALSGVCCETLDISDEVKEQVELVLAQFKRAKERTDPPDVQLYEDLLSLYNNSSDVSAEPTALRRISEKLHLMGIAELTQESLALLDMVAGGDPGQSIEKMSMILKKIKDYIQTENPDLSYPTSSGSGQALFEGSHSSHVIPDDFRCPISLDLMKDPVIVSTGQTYERACIQKWLEEGHVTCPKTQQTLINTTLTPNYVLRSLIGQWCEGNGIEPPKRPSVSEPAKTKSAFSAAQRTKIENLLHKLMSSSPDDQLSAAGEIRLLAKRNSDNRVAIAEAGAIPLLVGLLSTLDSRIQEHVVTSLLNLSIREDNKATIISSGAIPGIIHVLKKGNMEARENAAATFFSLSVVDGNKAKIGASGAIPPLITLLSEGTQRGKKDAATALFNLCIYQGNKGKAVRAGLVPILMDLLTEPGGAMVDEALTILAVLVNHSDGKAAIGDAGAVPILVEIIGTGSPRNRENATSVLVHLFSGDQYIIEAQNLEVMRPLIDLTHNGTERGKLKAAQLIERINRFFEQQNLAQAKAEDHAQQSAERAVSS